MRVVFCSALLLLLSWCGSNIPVQDRFLDDVVVVAHVGAPKEATYNSLEWFALAKEYGADAVEFDVSLTKDNKNIVMHGPSMEMNSICKHLMKNVAEYTLDELQDDCKLRNGEPIRTLEEMLWEIDAWFKYYFIELKVYDEDKIGLQADDVIQTIKKFDLESKAIVTSYDHKALKYVVDQWIICAWDTYTLSEFHSLSGSKYAYLMTDFRILDDATIDYVNHTDKKLVAYTAYDLAQFKQMYADGIRIIMTDDIQDTMQYVLYGTGN